MTVDRSRRTSRSQSSSSSRPSSSSASTTSDADRDRPLTSLYLNTDETDAQDVAMAIAALGLMRRGSSSTGGGEGGRPPRPHPHVEYPTSRSASIASTSSAAWYDSGLNSSSGTSSPVGPASVLEDGGSGASVGGSFGYDVGDGHEDVAEGDPRFMARVSQLPLVSGGLEWYERSKASSRVVKYGAGLVESSLSSISRPLANNLQLGQLDEFACRQLDRLGGTGGAVAGDEQGAHVHKSDDVARKEEEEVRGRDKRASTEASGMTVGTMDARTRTMSPATRNQQVVAVASRSRWQTVLVEAGGLGAAVSEESLKSLRYCLQWLLYATAHLDHQITVLRDFIASLHRHRTTDWRSDALVTASATAHLGQIKHDVVDTIRKVVEVVSKYAGAALPEPAKRYVRQSILGLPVKWASAIEGGRDVRAASVGTASSAGTPTAERMEDPTAPAKESSERAAPESTGRTNPALRPTEDAAERVLTFAVESLDMLKSVTQIFGDSVEKAEAWIERLRIIGMDRQRQRQAAEDMSPPPPAEPTVNKRRRAIARDSDGSIATGMESMDNDDGITRRKKGPRSRESTANSFGC